MTQKDIADQLGSQLSSLFRMGAWSKKQPSREKVKAFGAYSKSIKGYFTELEIVRLYNTLSDEDKDQALNYVRSLVQKKM